MAWFSQSKGGGGTTDTTARAQASAAAAKIDALYKSSGDKVKAKSTAFIVMSDGSIGQYSNLTAADITVPNPAADADIISAGFTKPTASGKDSRLDNVYKVAGDKVKAGSEVFIITSTGAAVNYKNPTAGDLTVPDPASDASIIAAGFTQLAATETSDQIIAVWQTKRTAWVADGGNVDFTTSEPAKTAGNAGKIYLNNKTGNGFNKDSLYELLDDLTWKEYKPSSGWTLSIGLDKFTFDGTVWKPDLKGDHLHVFVGDANTNTYYAFGKNKFWRNKVTTPNFTILPGQTGWPDNWEEVTQATGLNYINVVDNDTLVAKQFSVAEPATNQVVHLTAPAATKNSFFTVINTGDGIVDVGGVQVIGNGALEFTSNEAGTSWVLTAKEGVTVVSGERTSKTFKKVAHNFKVGNAVYFDGSAFQLADSKTETTSDSLGIVSKIIDVDNFELTSEGYLSGIAQTGLTPGAVFLSETAGELTETAPTTGYFKPVMILDSATSGFVIQRAATDLSLATSSGVEVLDAWLDSTNTDHTKKGSVSFAQIKKAILEEYKFYNSGTWDANDAYKSLNQFVAGSSGVEVSSFPNGLSKPQAFISEYYGNSTNGYQRLQIFGTPASTRGVWSRSLSGSNWTPWQLETTSYFDFTPSPGTPGDNYTVSSGNIAINDGDTLLLRDSPYKNSVRATPVTTWDKVSKIDVTATAKADGWTIEGSQPTSGNAVIDIFIDNFAKKWIIRAPSSQVSGKTIHDFGLTTVTGLKTADSGAECHIEGGAGYSLDKVNLKDGDEFLLINTSGADVAKALTFTGFAGVYDRADGGKAITGDYPLKKDDARLIRITDNAGNWYANLHFTNQSAKAEVITSDTAPTNPGYDAVWVQPAYKTVAPLILTDKQVRVTVTSLSNPGTAFPIGFNPKDATDSIYIDGTGWAGVTVSAGTIAAGANPNERWGDWLLPDGTFNAGMSQTITFPVGADIAFLETAYPSVNPFVAYLVELINTTTSGIENYVWNSASQAYERPSEKPSTDGFKIHSNIKNKTTDAWEWIEKKDATSSDLTQTQVESATDTTTGLVSGELLAQSISKNVKADLETLLGVSVSDKDLGTFTGTTIPDDSTVKAAIQSLEDKLETYKVTGRYIGSATTFATLPTTSTATGTAINGDWVALNADEVGTGTALAPQYPKGVYIYDGSKYSFAFALASALVNLTKTQVEDAASTDFGLVSGERLAESINKNLLKPYVFADKTTVAAAVLTKPTVAEITTFANAKTPKVRNQFIYYTETDTATDAVYMAFYVDGDGLVKQIMDVRSTIIQNWAASSPVFPGCIRRFAPPQTGSAVFAMFNLNQTARVSGTSIDVTELSKWDLIGQPAAGTWVPNAYYMIGTRIIVNNCIYRCQNNHKSGASFSLSELTINWTRETGTLPTTIATGVVTIRGNGSYHLKAGANTALSIASEQRDMFTLKNIDGFTYTISPPAGETINGVASFVSNSKNELLVFTKDTSDWVVSRVGGASDSIQNINATGNITDWGSTVVIGTTAPTANMTLTLPTAANNIGKKITLVRADNTTFTVTLAAQGGETLSTLNNANEVSSQHGSLTVEAITATSIRQVSQVVGAASRSITGTGIANGTLGRDRSVVSVRITGLTAGSEITQGNISASGGATVDVVDTGRNGTATVNIIVNGNDTVVTYTQTVWRRTVSAVRSTDSTAVNVDGVASKNIDATISQAHALAVPDGFFLSAVTITGGTVTGFTDSGLVSYLPNNAANVVITATFSGKTRLPPQISQANSGIAVAYGTIAVQIAGGGNRSLQVRSNTGSSITLRIQNLWSDGGAGSGLVNLTATTTMAYINTSWNFGNSGQHQTALINDVTNNRFYYVVAEIGSAYNNCSYGCYEL